MLENFSRFVFTIRSLTKKRLSSYPDPNARYERIAIYMANGIFWFSPLKSMSKFHLISSAWNDYHQLNYELFYCIYFEAVINRKLIQVCKRWKNLLEQSLSQPDLIQSAYDWFLCWLYPKLLPKIISTVLYGEMKLFNSCMKNPTLFDMPKLLNQTKLESCITINDIQKWD